MWSRRDPRVLLRAVAEAAKATDAFIEGLDPRGHMRSPLVHSAVQREFEIIGEALGQLARIDADLTARIPDAARIVAFRNLLIHGYAVVEHARVYRTARESLPTLREYVVELLAELDGRKVR